MDEKVSDAETMNDDPVPRKSLRLAWLGLFRVFLPTRFRHFDQ